MGPPKRPVSRELPSRDSFRVDVQADGSCLFWSTALAYLIPVKDNEDEFKQRYTALFGDREIGHISYVRELIQNYNPLLDEVPNDDTLKNLVSNTFRNRVVDYIQSHEDDFKEYISDEFFQYLNNMRKPGTWGGEPEIMAISKILKAKIDVSGEIQSHYHNGDIPIQLFHVSIIEGRERNHYNFNLPQNIVDAYRDNVENIPGQRSSTKSDRHNVADQRSSTKPELIELLLTEPINTKYDKSNPVLVINRENPTGFAEKFSLFLEETPCGGSASKKEFFIHAVLGSVLTLSSSGLKEELGIKNVYIKHDIHVEHNRSNAKVVLSDVIKLCSVFEKDGKKRIALRVFVSDKTTDYKNLKDEHRYSDGELKEIAEKLGIFDINSVDVDEHVFLICTEKDQNNSSQFKLYKGQIDGVKERFKAVASFPSQTDKFKEVKMDKSASLEKAFQGLSRIEVSQVENMAKEIFNKFIKIHKKNKEKFSLFNSEAADHGFAYGALALNFKYRYGLNCYVERTGGSGRADLMFMSRTKDANGKINPKPIPVIIEFKGSDHTASEAINQIKDKGYLYNLSVRTKAEDAVIVGTSFAHSNALQVEKSVIFQSRGFLLRLLEEVKNFDENDVSEMQDNLRRELEFLYHAIRSHDRHCLSKVILGQVLAAEVDGFKRIFTYEGEDKSIEKEATTFVLCNRDKAVILNIIEHAGGQRKTREQKRFDDNKIPSIDKLEFDSAVKVDVKIDVGVKGQPGGAKNPVVAFEVEGDKSKSYYQNIKIEKVISSKNKYCGTLKAINNVNICSLIKELREGNNESEGSSSPGEVTRSSVQWSRKSNNKLEGLSSLKEALFTYKESIKNEADFKAIMQGLLMNGKDESGKEIRAYVESDASPKGRIDLLLSFTYFKDDSFEEGYPIIIELKYAKDIKKAYIKLKEAREQLDEKYNLVRSCTSKRTAQSLAMVFNKGAKNPDKLLILSKIKNFKVPHTTSQSETDSQTVVDSPDKTPKRPVDDGRSASRKRQKISYESSSSDKKQESVEFGSREGSSSPEGSLNSEYTASSSDEKQRLDECDFQEDSLSLDNLSLVPQVGSPDRKRELDECDFQENILFGQRKKRKRGAEPYKEPERSVKSNLDDVSVQSHLTKAKDLGLR